MEEILIVSNYYPPEKGAAPNRIEQLALKLQANNYKVSVVCPLANYPKGQIFPDYKGRFSVRETRDGIAVKRLWIYPSNSHNIFKRIVSIFSFSVCLFFYLLLGKTPKKVIVQSPPLLLSFVAVFVLRLKRRKIILNVSDLWPMAAVELGVLKPDTFSHKCLKTIERTLYRKASLVLGQSNEIIAHVRQMAPAKDAYLYRNFPDHAANAPVGNAREKDKIKVFYAGLLGVAQGVLETCEKMVFDSDKIEYHIFGDGAERLAIENYIAKHPEKNIVFHGMLDRSELLKKLADFDIAFVPLKTRIYGSVPSKIFEYAALGIPILYFGGGEGETVVYEYRMGWVAKVGDFDELNQTLASLAHLGGSERDAMKKAVLDISNAHFNLDRQLKNLIDAGVF